MRAASPLSHPPISLYLMTSNNNHGNPAAIIILAGIITKKSIVRMQVVLIVQVGCHCKPFCSEAIPRECLEIASTGQEHRLARLPAHCVFAQPTAVQAMTQIGNAREPCPWITPVHF